MNKIKDSIIIFGRGEYYKAKKDTFFTNFKVYAFLDNSVKTGSLDEETGLPVYNPRDVVTLPNYDIFCVSAAFMSMWKQLLDLGVDCKRIKFGAIVPPFQEGIEKVAFSRGEKLICDYEKLIYETAYEKEYYITCLEDLKNVVRKINCSENINCERIKQLTTEPVSRNFGSEFGKAVDRWYIERFLRDNSGYIRGATLEVANSIYTNRYGGNKVTKAVSCHVKGWGDCELINFETGEGVIQKEYDCIICTQTLQYIFDLEAAVRNIYKMLKKGGCALITVPGIKPLCRYDNDNWGEYWSFTCKSIDRLCSMICGPEDYHITVYGNPKIATAYLYGICVEELSEEDLLVCDEQYPFIICARILKTEK